jgi:molybdopterin biosynthesis enzyme
MTQLLPLRIAGLPKPLADAAIGRPASQFVCASRVAIFLLLSSIFGALTMALTPPMRGPDELQHFLRAIVTDGPRGPDVKLTGPQGSGILTSMALANALLIIPEGQQETPPGSTVQALVLNDPVHQEQPGF